MISKTIVKLQKKVSLSQEEVAEKIQKVHGEYK